MPTNTTRQQVRLCLCGCQREVRNEFAQGHDARLRSRWLQEWRAGGMNIDPADELSAEIAEEAELPTSALEHYCEFNPCRRGCKSYRKLRDRDWLPWQHRSWGRNGNQMAAMARRNAASMPLNEEGQPYDPASFAAADAANSVLEELGLTNGDTLEREQRAIYDAQVENEGAARG